MPSPGSVGSLPFGATRQAIGAGVWVCVQWCECAPPHLAQVNREAEEERLRGEREHQRVAGCASRPRLGLGPAEDPPPRHWQEPALL